MSYWDIFGGYVLYVLIGSVVALIYANSAK